VAEGRLRDVRIVLSVTAARSALFFIGQIEALRREGARVFVMTHPSDDVARLCEREGAVFLPVAMERAPAPRADLAALARATTALRQVRPDLVLAGTPKAGLVVTVAAAAVGVPSRVHALHGLRFESARGATRAMIWAAQRASCAAATHVLCVSRSLRARAVEARVVPASRAIVLGDGSINGVDLARFDPIAARPAGHALRRELGIGADAAVVGFIGRLARDKGIAELTEAWIALGDPRAHLLVAGDADETDPPPPGCLARLAADPRVHLLGHREIVPVHAALDVLALPTYREGMPTAILEAAAMGVPVVSTRATGCVDAVEDGRTGTLVAIGDATALRDALRRYLASPALRASHGAAGRARVVERFASDRVVERTTAFLSQLVEGR
jgi:glycosyltransferase involved in cell wall biosynthesis